MELTITNPQRTASGGIDCTVFHPLLNREVPFHATADDEEDFGKAVWAVVSKRKDIAPAPEPVADRDYEVRKVRLMRSMRDAGVWKTVRAAINAGDEDAKEDWEASEMIPRNDPLVEALAASVGLSEEQIDAIFEAAR